MAVVSHLISIIPPHRRFIPITEPNTVKSKQASKTQAPHRRHSSHKITHFTEISEEGGVSLVDMRVVAAHANAAQTSARATERQNEHQLPQRRKNDRWIKNSDIRRAKWPTHRNLSTVGGGSVKGTATPGYSLMDYDGSWAPPPEDWDTRPAFDDHQATELVSGWLDTIDTDPRPLRKAFTYDADTHNFCTDVLASDGSTKRYHFVSAIASDSIIGDIVPRSWIPKNIEALNDLQSFWQYHKSMAPTPLDDVDLVGAKPWWEMYPSPNATFHLTPQQPEHKGIDITDENANQRRDRLQDTGSSGAVQRWLTRRANKRRAKRQSPPRSRVTDLKPVDSFLKEDPVPEACLPLTPQVNLYIRSAQKGDVLPITEIYNWHVSNSVCVPECEPVPPTHMLDRLQCMRSVNLPFIVACQSSDLGQKGKAKTYRAPDKIIGIAYADDYNDMHGMYRFTAELEFYVHPEFRQKGVAKCLMDKLLNIADEGHLPRGGYDVRDDELGLGSQRTLSKLIVNVPYNEQEGTKKWLGSWLESCGFEQKGDIDDIGHKLSKR